MLGRDHGVVSSLLFQDGKFFFKSHSFFLDCLIQLREGIRGLLGGDLYPTLSGKLRTN